MGPMYPWAAALRHPNLVPAIIAALIVVAAAWIVVSLSRWRRITWRDDVDTSINLVPKEAGKEGGWRVWRVLTDREEVANPSLVLLRVRNSGFRSIDPDDIRRPISFTFPYREVKEFEVTSCRGVTREMIQPARQFESANAGNRISLPRFAMKRNASFKLLVLLSGTDQGVVGKGHLRRGRVMYESRRRGPDGAAYR